MQRLVYAQSLESGHCRSCGAVITWVRLPGSGKRAPFDGTVTPIPHLTDSTYAYVDDGMNPSHFATCPDAAQWRKAR